LAALLLAQRGATLVVCPLSVLPVWEDQLRTFAPDLTVHTYHGAGKNSSAAFLLGFDVVLTTYKTLAQGSLKGVPWHRVVLDEAHEIRNYKAAQALACVQLRAEVRWCVTGTPLINKIGDIYGLVSFLQIQPFSELKWWRRMIERPAQAGNLQGVTRLCQLLGDFLLRRTKALQVKGPDGSSRPILQLPERVNKVERLPLSGDERKLYDRLFSVAVERVVSGWSQGSCAGDWSQNALCLLTRLRQVCCAAELLPSSLLQRLQRGEAGELERELLSLDEAQRGLLLRQTADAPGAECSICLEPLLEKMPCFTPCAHLFHKACLTDWLDATGTNCPLCKAPCAKADVVELPEEGLESAVEEALGASSEPAPQSAKLAWAARFLERQTKDHKVVVFSQFAQLLGKLAQRLDSSGVRYVCLTGNMPGEKRKASVQAFQSDEKVRAVLCSTKCAGAGITLTRGDRVLLLDPWWNLPIEEQAIDRVHRIGQTRPVEVVRLVAEHTVEEQMLMLKDVKHGIFERALSIKAKGEQTRLDVVLKIFRGPWTATSSCNGERAGRGAKAGSKRKRAPA